MSEDLGYDTVTALAESDATGKIADIFSDIRHTMQIPILTSIWRVLADSETDLDLTWKAVKPLYATGQPEAGLARLRSEAKFPVLEPVSLSEIDAIGMPSEEFRSAKAVLAAYNRSNSLNLITLTALLTDQPEEHVEYPSIKTAFVPNPLPKLLPRDEISDSVWETVLQINTHGTKHNHPSLATIFRHLAYWPDLLSLMESRLANAQKLAAIPTGADSVANIAMEEGYRLSSLRDDAALSKMSVHSYNTIANYVDGPFKVARIVNIGTALIRSLDEC